MSLRIIIFIISLISLIGSFCSTKKSEVPIANYQVYGPLYKDSTEYGLPDFPVERYRLEISEIKENIYIECLYNTNIYSPKDILFIKRINEDSSFVFPSIRDFITNGRKMLKKDSIYYFDFWLPPYSDVNADSIALGFEYFLQDSSDHSRLMVVKMPFRSRE